MMFMRALQRVVKKGKTKHEIIRSFRSKTEAALQQAADVKLSKEQHREVVAYLSGETDLAPQEIDTRVKQIIQESFEESQHTWAEAFYGVRKDLAKLSLEEWDEVFNLQRMVVEQWLTIVNATIADIMTSVQQKAAGKKINNGKAIIYGAPVEGVQ